MKYNKIRTSSDPYFPIYDSVRIRENTDTILSIYRKISISKACISPYLTQGLERNTSFKLDWPIFFLRLIVIELLVSEIIKATSF